MPERKLTNQYVFTVEGETEKWYLEWLAKQINDCENSKVKVSIVARVQKNPFSFAKNQTSMSIPTVTHLCDYESNEEVHQQIFREMLDNLRKANTIKGRKLKYYLGYSNYTFELWIVLHKVRQFGSLTHRRQYLTPINRIFSEHFENLDEYKREANFKRCLGKLELSDVIFAVQNSKELMQIHIDNGLTPHEYRGVKYYTENPSLTIWEAIEKILKDCGLIS